MHKTVKNVQNPALNVRKICTDEEIFIPLHGKNKEINLIIKESEVKNEASFTNDLGADSLDTVELIMEFEKEFGISIPDDQAEKIATVGDAINYIEEHSK